MVDAEYKPIRIKFLTDEIEKHSKASAAFVKERLLDPLTNYYGRLLKVKRHPNGVIYKGWTGCSRHGVHDINEPDADFVIILTVQKRGKFGNVCRYSEGSGRPIVG